MTEASELAEQVLTARRAGRPVVWLVGRRAIAMGLGPLIVDLLRRGLITHLALDGDGSAFDFELALCGEVCTRPQSAMAEEAMAELHAAIRQGGRYGLGLGEALGRALASGPRYQHRDSSPINHAYALGVPLTVHVALGSDRLTQSAACDCGSVGWASGLDFRVLCASAKAAAEGVALNLAMGDRGEDLLDRAAAVVQGMDGSPCVLHRVQVDARLDADGLATVLQALLNAQQDPIPLEVTQRPGLADNPGLAAGRRSPDAATVLQDLLARDPALVAAAGDLVRAYLAIAESLERGGTIFLCGNGGSLTDAMHMSGEMLKSYAHPRPLPEEHRRRLLPERNGDSLVSCLEQGLRAVVLGMNPALSSAVNNDFIQRDLAYAQELYALARPGDVLLGISTSGKAANVGSAASVARALGLTTIGLTGPGGSALAAQVDVAIRVPGERTDRIQERHVVLYHALCEMLEVDFFRPT